VTAKPEVLDDGLEDYEREVLEDWDRDEDPPREFAPPLSLYGSQRRVVLTSEAEMEALAPPAWLVDGVLPEQGLALMFGASETFKSFIALDLLLCIALGLDWHGHRVREGKVVYVAAEGFFGMQKRYLAWKQYGGVTGDLGIYFLRHGIDVRNGSRDLRELREEIEEKLDGRVAAIVLDTLNRNLVGNENLPDDMGAYLRGCDELKAATEAVVLSIHHTGHLEAERGRGHSSLRGALDVEMKCARDGDRVTIECTKMKDAPHFLPISFDMVAAGDSLVPKVVGTVDKKLTPARATALAVVPSEGGLSRSAWCKATELPKGTFRHALDWCLVMGYVRQVRDGKFVKTAAATLVECQ
jgi:AAA domain